MRQKKKKKKPRWEWNIGASRGCWFKPKDKDLIMKMFEVTLDDYIRQAKKSHWIQLQCRWRNIGCGAFPERRSG